MLRSLWTYCDLTCLQFDRLERTLRESSGLAAADILLIRSNKPAAGCIEKLHDDVAKASATFRGFKDCFYLLSDEASTISSSLP